MTTTVDVEGVTHRFGGVLALDDVTLRLEEPGVHGLLGRNGAGKTTLLQIVAGHLLPSAGRVEVSGRAPFENARALAQICLVREGQRYPDGYRVHHVLRAASLFFPHWDAERAARLADEFELPPRRGVAKLSRGMLSAVGVVVGLASRAPLTLFDEPYLGLDAVARQRFYDHLLADVAEHPRTVLLSTHLIDEIADLLQRVVVIDHGRVLVQADADELRREAVTVTGPAGDVEAVVDRLVRDGGPNGAPGSGPAVLARERLGGVTRVTLRLAGTDLDLPPGAPVQVEPVPLQRLVVLLTTAPAAPASPLPTGTSPVGTPQGASR